MRRLRAQDKHFVWMILASMLMLGGILIAEACCR